MIYAEDDVVFCLGIKLYSVLSLVSLLSKQGNSAEVPVLLWHWDRPLSDDLNTRQIYAESLFKDNKA